MVPVGDEHDIVLSDRVVEVWRRRADSGGDWSVGSGFLMRDHYVLTAAHCVDATGELVVKFRGSTRCPARLCRLPSGLPAIDEEADLAILDVWLDGASDFPPVALARLNDKPTLRSANLEECVAFGFPTFQEKVRDGMRVRESVRIDGYIPMGEGAVEGLPTLRVRDAPESPPVPVTDLGRSPWSGISGAVVFSRGVAIGVISEHHAPAGLNGLTVVPLSRLDSATESRGWWELLGADDPGAIATIPADEKVDAGPESDAEVIARYKALLRRSRQFEQLVTPFVALPAEFYLPRLLRPTAPAGSGPGQAAPDEPVQSAEAVVDSEERLVITAPAGMGKSALLHELVRRFCSDELEGVPVFVRLHEFARRHRGRDLITFAVEESLGETPDRAEIERMIGALRRLTSDAGTVFLLDGLDEVPLRQQEEILARVRTLPRFVLTSRPMSRLNVLAQAPVYVIDQLQDRDVAQFVGIWAAHDPATAELLTRIRDDDDLAEISRLPQLLTLMCWLVAEAADLGEHNRIGIVSAAVDEALNRALRLSDLTEGSEETVPRRARDGLRRAALDSFIAGDGLQLTFSGDRLLSIMEGVGGQEPAGLLLSFARRSGLIVAAGGSANDFEFLHQVFRAQLAGEALAALADPAPAIDALLGRGGGEDVLAAAVARGPASLASLILERAAVGPQDIFRMNWRLAALSLEGLTDLRRLDADTRHCADEILAGASEWWSRARFAPVVHALRTDYMRGRLREWISDAEPFKRWAAVEGLKFLGEGEAVPALIERLPLEPWGAIQTSIVSALGRLGDRAAIAPIWHYFESQRGQDSLADFHSIGESLARLHADDAIRQLIATDDDEEAVDAMIGARRFADPELADEILATLSSRRITVNDQGAIDHYVELAGRPDATTEQRLDAVYALRGAGSQAAADELLNMMVYATDDEVHDEAARALVDLEGDVSFLDVIQFVVDHLLADDGDLRILGAWAVLLLWDSAAQDALQNLEFSGLRDPLNALLDDDEAAVRLAAAILMLLIQVDAPEPAGDDASDPSAILQDSLGHEEPAIRAAAASAIGFFGITTHSLTDAIANDPDRRVRLVSLTALSRLGGEAADQVVVRALSSDDPDIRAAAASALGRHQNADAMDAIADALPSEPDPRVQAELLDSAATLSPFLSLPSFIEEAGLRALRDTDTRVRSAAARLAGAASISAASPILHDMMRDADEELAGEAADAFGRVASRDDLMRLVDEIPAAGFGGSLMDGLAEGVRTADDITRRAVMERIEATGGVALASDAAVVIQYPNYTYRLLVHSEEQAGGSTIEDLSDADPARRFAAVQGLAANWDASGVLGRLVLAMLDPHPIVADSAASVIAEVSRDRTLDRLDDESVALIRGGDSLVSVIGLLDSGGTAATAAAWLLAEPVFLPDLMRAHARGQESTRRVLWDMADRHQLRLLPDGTARLVSGRVAEWDQLPALL
ncbi:HEAT repeat domain-containing protein [Microbacterium sp. E-13]|uniref:HEAT repeat domain-containing protein n=1 Tax=Microbacterium sp. E-13 TaxID=3404048 RepID=UPI003CF0A482